MCYGAGKQKICANCSGAKINLKGGNMTNYEIWKILREANDAIRFADDIATMEVYNRAAAQKDKWAIEAAVKDVEDIEYDW